MSFTVRFLLDKEGELIPMAGGIQEVEGEDNIRNILNTKVHQIIRLGIAPDKRAYMVTKINHRYQGGKLHMDIAVTPTSDTPSD